MELLQFNLDGIQESEDSARPIPFSVEDKLLAGGVFDKDIHRALVAMFLKDMFPISDKNSLFDWSIAPNAIITYVSFVHDMNIGVNKQNLQNGRRLVEIPDAEVVKKVNRLGVLTPFQIEEKFVSRNLSDLRKGPGLR